MWVDCAPPVFRKPELGVTVQMLLASTLDVQIDCAPPMFRKPEWGLTVQMLLAYSSARM